jgi:acyl-CoA thioester hydrolase
MPPIDRFVAETEIGVRYAETDAQGVVYHANYLVYMEEGRTAFSQQRGMNYVDFEKSGYFMIVTDVNLHYLRPARYGDRIVVRVWVHELRSRTIVFGYEIALCGEGAVLVTGETKHMCVDRQGKVTRIPDAWATAFLPNAAPS